MGAAVSTAKKVEPEQVKTEGEGVDAEAGGFFSAFKTKKYVDPPMPNIGKFVDFDRLLERKKNVKHTMKTMFKVVEKDCGRSIDSAKTIPVSDMIERVKITDPIMESIKNRKSKKEDRQFVKDNLLESQRYLSLRRSSLDMMNHNYDDKTVRELELVYAEEARGKMTLKEESHVVEEEVKDDDKDMEPYSDTESMFSVAQSAAQGKKKKK